MIKNEVEKILNEVKNLNPFGEEVVVVGATKFVDTDKINESILAGLKDVGENRAQEFRDKHPLLLPVNYHFFGRLQRNKVKYLIGKCHLIQSVDSYELLDEISSQSTKQNLITNILLEVNLGEEQKGGIILDKMEDYLNYSSKLNGVKVMGLMCVLPNLDDEKTLQNQVEKLRKFYDLHKQKYGFKHLSIGMSNDYLLAVKYGSNMIRIGSKIYGARK